MKKLIAVFFSVVAVFLFVTIAKAAGFDQFGYNYNAMLFNGKADGVDKVLDGKVWGDPTYANDNLIMKWSKAWNDARFNSQPWTCDAWENNEWNGAVKGGSGEVWHYKIVWVGPEKLEIVGTWNLNFVYGGNYQHTLIIDSYDYDSGNFTGTGFYNSNMSYTWLATGNISGANITLHIVYTGINAGYTVNATGILSPSETITGNWSGPGQVGVWSGNGDVMTNAGPCWREGGSRIWGEFETIMDQGTTKGEGHS